MSRLQQENGPVAYVPFIQESRLLEEDPHWPDDLTPASSSFNIAQHPYNNDMWHPIQDVKRTIR